MRKTAFALLTVSAIAAACSGGGGGGGGPTPTPTPSPTPTPIPNTALKFDGTDDFASLADDGAFDFTNAVTIEAWIKPDPGNGVLDSIISGSASAPPASSAVSYQLSDSALSISVPNTDSALAGAPVDSQWVHIAGTYDATTVKLYENGVLLASKTHSNGGNISPAISFLNLATLGGTNCYGGLIDEVRIWNVVRTPAEILANYNHSLTGTEAGLIGYWKFDEGAGQTAASSAGGAHGFGLGTSVAADASDPTWVLSDVPLLD